ASPWQRVVPSKSLVPDGWGLYSCGTGRPTVVLPAHDNQAAEPLSPFELALPRAAQPVGGAGALLVGDEAEAPIVDVIRPYLSRGHVGLGCHHAAMSMAKVP